MIHVSTRVPCWLVLSASLLLLAEGVASAEEVKPRSKNWLEVLRKPITLEKGIEPNTPLRDALEFLADRYHVTIVVDSQAFDTDLGMKEIESTSVRLPRLNGVRLGAILRLLLDQVNASYLVRPDYIEVTTPARVWQAVRVEGERQRLPLVHAVFERLPLQTALEEVADLTGFNVVVDTRSGERALAKVSATLRNVPVDTAVRLLADLADLQAVLLDNTLYVTTKENARTWEAARETKRQPEPKAAGEAAK